MPGRPMTEEQNLPSWLFVVLSLARGLKFDDVERALSYAGPFLVRMFLFASCSSRHTHQFYLSRNSV